jgi:hypothetical protein
MPPSDICFGWQTHCRNDGGHPNWVFNTKVSTQLLQIRPNGNPFLTLSVYYQGWIQMTKSVCYRYFYFYLLLFQQNTGEIAQMLWLVIDLLGGT